jgi:PAS domain S-box-containing protein
MLPISIFLLSLSVVLIAGLIVFLILTNRRLKRAQAQEEVAEKDRDSFEQILQQANDALLIIDTVQGRVLECNQEAANLLNYAREELKSRTIFDLHPQEYLSRSSEIIADVWEKGGLVFEDLPLRTKEGEELPVESSARVIDFRNKPAILIFARDIRERLRMQREIREQTEIIEEKNKDLTDSIRYAQRIQRSILPEDEDLTKAFPNAFVFYRPKDIVSGDFYWYAKRGAQHFFVVADCTGHGVPGAFMSMLGSSKLKEIIHTKDVTEPGQIVSQLHREIRETLRQETDSRESALDGMDLAMIRYDETAGELRYAGALRPLLCFRAGQHDENGQPAWQEIKPDRVPVGGMQTEPVREFHATTLELAPGDTFYMYTDGFPDQFGGPKGKKYMDKRLKRLLAQLQEYPMQEQYDQVVREIDGWMGKQYEQIDDILLAGIRFDEPVRAQVQRAAS